MKQEKTFTVTFNAVVEVNTDLMNYSNSDYDQQEVENGFTIFKLSLEDYFKNSFEFDEAAYRICEIFDVKVD